MIGSFRAGGELLSWVEPEPGARYPGTNNNAAAAYAHADADGVNTVSPSIRFDGHVKPVAHTAFGLDDPRSAGIGFELAAQSKHLHVDTSIEDIFVHPGRLQELLACQGSLRRLQECDQQRVLAFGQGDRAAIRSQQPALFPLETPAGELVSAALRLAGVAVRPVPIAQIGS